MICYDHFLVSNVWKVSGATMNTIFILISYLISKS